MRTFFQRVLIAALAASSCAQEQPTVLPPAHAVRVVIKDSNIWRTHVPGSPFTVNVHVVGAPAEGSSCTCWWVDAERIPLSDPVPVSSVPTAMVSPLTTPGFLGLVFRSSRPDVAFEPQAPGQPSSVYGFAVIQAPPEIGAKEVLEVGEGSAFGLVQGRVSDPYLRMGSGPRVTGVHLKTKTWSQSTRGWGREIALRRRAGHVEMPLIHREPWDSDDSKPIGGDQLDAIAAKFAAVLSSDASAAARGVGWWQAGREENGGKPYERAYYFSNLLAKMKRLQAEVASAGRKVRFAYSTRGKDMREFEQLFASEAFRTCYDGLAHDPYWWPDFPAPETWLPKHVKDLRTRMVAAGVGDHFLWFGEIGIPVRGTNDSSAFYGYPAKKRSVPGCSLDYAARYLVKCHALALANGVERLYWYNYQNRGNDIDYAEHHFGLRTFSGSRADPGHPLPAYVAYIQMLANLKGARFVGQRSPAPDVLVFEFAVTGTRQRRLLVWAAAERQVAMPLGALAANLNEAQVQSVTDIYGANCATAIKDRQVVLSSMPLFIRL
ncbi:MAG: hypothetical protein AB8H80_03455 [Planctomycetota bacterium]